MEITFDDIKSGFNSINRDEDKQLSLFDYTDIELPNIQTKEKVTKKRSTPNINSIKTMKQQKKFEKVGTGTIQITGCSTKNKVISAVSEKTKKCIDERNRELLRLKEHPYVKIPFLLTNAEKKLYKFLKTRISREATIFAKIRLADIVSINEAITRDSKTFRKIAYKHVDFAIVDANLDIICIVELDDYTHETAEAKERDQFVLDVLRECNIPLYRIGVRIDLITKEDTRFIELCILDHMAPVCPKCGRPMEPKESKHKSNYGHRFYGCMGFYESGNNKCTYTIDID